MAEATLSGNNESSSTPSTTSRFFCHKCDQDIQPLPEFICPRCRLGFIEEVESPSGGVDSPSVPQTECPTTTSPGAPNVDGTPDENEVEIEDDVQNPPSGLSDLLEDIYGQLTSSGVHNDPTRGQGASGSSSSSSGEGMSSYRVVNGGPADRRPTRRTNRPTLGSSNAPFEFRVPSPTGSSTGTTYATDASHALEGIFQHILANVATGVLPRDAAGRATLAAHLASGPGITFEYSIPYVQILHGNPGDYAWGSQGLDAVITQLLNNLDGSGPPPMSSHNIEKVPFVEVAAEDVAKNLQCSVCMEDFKFEESVRKLTCGHLYHNDCIVPWLEMHATCPICRKLLNETMDSSSDRNNDHHHHGSSSSSSTSSSHDRPTGGGGGGSTGTGSSAGGGSSTSSSLYYDNDDYD